LAYQIPKLFQDIEPDFVFYQAGVDILETDRLGRLKITRNGCLERDNLVLKNCYSNKVPVVVVMGGGYSTLLTDIVEAHCNTFRTAMNLFF
jgi:acetoin utilization deacetylase AcuC-like enzyme